MVHNTPQTKLEPCPVKDCILPVDIILEASEGERFGAHISNLQQFSEGFPFAESVDTDDAELPRFEETGEVLSLMLHFMHLVRQPDISRLEFTTLSALAEAAEKYMIYSAMGIAKVYMSLAVEQHPLSVLMYALKHDYIDLANTAAKLTVAYDSSTVVAETVKANLNCSFALAWFKYRDAWAQSMRDVVTNPPSTASFLHKGGYSQCELWEPFRDEVLMKVGLDWHQGFPTCMQSSKQRALNFFKDVHTARNEHLFGLFALLMLTEIVLRRFSDPCRPCGERPPLEIHDGDAFWNDVVHLSFA